MTSSRTALATLVLVAVFSAACDSDDGPSGPGITAGVGVTAAGSPLHLGDTRSDVQARLGSLQGLRDLGAVGVPFDYPALDVAGLLSGAGDDATVTSLELGPGFEGRTVGGLGVGSERATVEAGLGAPTRHPFLDAWWYPASGIGFEWEGDVAVRVHVFPAAP